MDELKLDKAEPYELNLLLNEVDVICDDAESSGSLLHSVVYAHKLPDRLRSAFNNSCLGRMSSLLRVSGYTVGQERIGPTPDSAFDQMNPIWPRVTP